MAKTQRNKCEKCGGEVIWGKNGCPHISEEQYEKDKFSIMAGITDEYSWAHYEGECLPIPPL